MSSSVTVMHLWGFPTEGTVGLLYLNADTAIDTSMYLRRQTLMRNEFIHLYSCDRDVRLCWNWFWSSLCERFLSSESLVQLLNLLLLLLLKLFVSIWLASVSLELTCCFKSKASSHLSLLDVYLLLKTLLGDIYLHPQTSAWHNSFITSLWCEQMFAGSFLDASTSRCFWRFVRARGQTH